MGNGIRGRETHHSIARPLGSPRTYPHHQRQVVSNPQTKIQICAGGTRVRKVTNVDDTDCIRIYSFYRRSGSRLERQTGLILKRQEHDSILIIPTNILVEMVHELLRAGVAPVAGVVRFVLQAAKEPFKGRVIWRTGRILMTVVYWGGGGIRCESDGRDSEIFAVSDDSVTELRIGYNRPEKKRELSSMSNTMHPVRVAIYRVVSDNHTAYPRDAHALRPIRS